jgi:hypothetical protein
MSLEDTIRELKSQLAESEKPEEEEKPEEVAAPEVKAEEAPAEPEKPAEPVVVKEETLDDAGYARLRREKRAAEKRAEELEAKLAERATAPEVVEEPSIHEALLPIIERDREERAFSEFQTLEDRFRASNPNYDDVAAQYASTLATAIKVQNPRLTQNQVVEQVKKEILKKAGTYLNAGFDPIEEMYHDAIELGFKPRAKEVAKEEPKEEVVKPDMAQLAKNRARSAGMVDTSGKEEGLLTKQAALSMSVGEYAKLPASERKRLLYGA